MDKYNKMPPIAVIGGTGLYEFIENSEKEIVETPYGKVEILKGKINGKEIFFINRHGKSHTIPPHKINFRANIFALHKLDVQRIIGVCSVGVINKKIKLDNLIVINDFFDLTDATTFYDNKAVHVDMTKPYCPELNDIILKSFKESNVPACTGSYACTKGPRLETPLEIKIFKQLGCDVVGLTSVPEAVLSRELGICYSTIAVPGNYASGLQEKLAASEIKEEMKNKIDNLKRILPEIIEKIPEERNCICKDALSDSEL